MIFWNLIDVVLRKILFAKGRVFFKKSLPIYGALFDYISIEIIIAGIFEKKQLEILREFALSRLPQRQRLNVIVDVGANIGNHSRYFSEFADRVVAVEPHPVTFSLLKLNTLEFPNVEPLNFGLSDRKCVLHMPRLHLGTAGSSLQVAPSDFAIECVTLDEIIPNKELVDLIKIDVEGHELQVLRGCAETIKRGKPIIVFEQLKAEIMNGTTPSIELLRSFGYRSFLYLEKNGQGGEDNSWFKRLCSVLMFGDRYSFVEKSIAPCRYHEMIVAIP